MKYSTLVDVYELLEGTSKRLEKVAVVTRFLEETPLDELDQVILLLQGKVFPSIDEKNTGVATKIVSSALMLATGQQDIEKHWKSAGDLGDVAYELTKTKKQQTLFSQRLTVSKVFTTVKKLTIVEGEGSTDTKQQYITELLTSAEPKEARYIVRTLLGDMRIGAGEGVLRDALVWAYYPKIASLSSECTLCHAVQPLLTQCVFCKGELTKINSEGKSSLTIMNIEEMAIPDETQFIVTPNDKVAREVSHYFLSEVQEALDVFCDFPLVAKRAKMRTLKKLLEAGLIPGRPLKLMLFQKASSIDEAFLIVGKPAACEFKYDGFRLQIHRNGNIIKLFTRRLEDVTPQFPDVVELVQTHLNSHDYIIDCEIVGFDKIKARFLPFQAISQRIQRKYDVHSMKKEIPVQLIVFDLLEVNGKTTIPLPFRERRHILTTITKEEEFVVMLAHQLITEKKEEVEEFYNRALEQGTEGIMIKNLAAPYKPGTRVGYGVKIKPTMETLDLAIIGGEWGEGKRVQWLSSFTLVCRNSNGDYVELGKVGTGFKEKGEGLTFSALTEQLKPLIITEKGREVQIKPVVVLEIAFEEIQQSPSYSSGFALRFPRVVRLRSDKHAEDCSSLNYVQQLFEEQNR